VPYSRPPPISEPPLSAAHEQSNEAISVTATHLKAEIAVGGVLIDFIDLNFDHPPITYPDDWDEIPVKDRLMVRATMEGMSVTRAIDQLAIKRIAAAMP